MKNRLKVNALNMIFSLFFIVLENLQENRKIVIYPNSLLYTYYLGLLF